MDRFLASSKSWRSEAPALREILLACGLDEELKWGLPCYCHGGKNLAVMQPMKAYLALMFFKGALLKDAAKVLRKPGANSRFGRRFELTSVRDITRMRATIKRYVREAIAIEQAGLKVPTSGAAELPDEVRARFARDKKLAAAFAALTPGRQRGYAIYFSAPKGSEARIRRLDKCVDKIYAGKSYQDR